MKKNIIILIVDDHSLIRKGVKLMLQYQDEFIPYIHEASTGAEVFGLMKLNKFDIILLDISLPDINGLDVLKKIKSISPQTPVLIQTMHKEKSIINQAIANGASGYILKNAESDELIHAVILILKKKNYFSNEVYQILNPIRSTSIVNHEIDESSTDLTPRECEILSMLSQEMTNSIIAELLFISKRTVEWHRKRIMKKLNINTTVGLVKYAIKNLLD